MKPFDIQEALAHPERVVHRDGRKAVQVAYFPKASPNSFCVLWEEGGSLNAYTDTGLAYKTASEPDVFLSTPPERVPFTVEDFKKGWEVVYRNGEKPLEVKVFEKISDEQPVVSVSKSGNMLWHSKNGKFHNDDAESSLDLFLLKPATT